MFCLQIKPKIIIKPNKYIRLVNNANSVTRDKYLYANNMLIKRINIKEIISFLLIKMLRNFPAILINSNFNILI